MNSSDLHMRFAGTWKLQADRSVYEYGTPPTSGFYTIESSGDDLLVSIDWTDDCGHTHSVHYAITPDGTEYAYERPDVAESVMARFAGEHVLETFAYKNGKTTMYAERRIDEDGNHMTITQKGHMPDGQPFCNVQHYERQY